MKQRMWLSSPAVFIFSLAFITLLAAPARADRDRGGLRATDSHGVLARAIHRGHSGTNQGGSDQQDTEVNGIVKTIDCGTNTLVVTTDAGDVTVTLDGLTTFTKDGHAAICSDITVGDTVEAKGAIQGDGSLLASIVKIESPDSGDTEISGVVKSIDCGTGALVVTTDSGDVAVTIDPSTTFKKQGNVAACADIAVGDVVEVSGATQGDGSILASKISIESPETEDTEISGVVKSIDCGSNTMVVTTDSGDVTVTFDGGTVFKTHDQAAACGDVAVGDAVEVSGALQGDGSILAAKVSFEAPEVEETEVSGTIDTIDTGAQTFILTTDSGPVTIATNSGTVIQEDHGAKTFGDLASGMSVEVDGVLQGDGSILATKISIEGSGD